MRLFNYKFTKLKKFAKNKSGRNNSGKLILRHRGGGVKCSYRQKNIKNNIYFSGTLIKFEQNRHQSATIGCFLYNTGIINFMLSVLHVKLGTIINPVFTNFSSSNKFLINTKSQMFLNSAVLLRNINIGTLISNIELIPGRGGQMLRTPSNFGQFLTSYKKKLNKKYALIRFRNKKELLFHPACSCLVGIINIMFYNFYKACKKAGQLRNLNKRPIVRGSAMNPVDHPMGGNTSGGKLSRSFSNVLSKGFKTTKYKTRKNFNIL